MLSNLKELYNHVLDAEDGEIGRCKDFLFDDKHWTIRYMVADTRKWLPGKKVLISPISLAESDRAPNLLPVRLTTDQIKEAPELDEHLPVSRQYEIQYHRYYEWPPYWDYAETWGFYPYPAPLFSKKEKELVAKNPAKVEPHLRSCKEVTNYHIQAEDGEVGHVEDFIVDDKAWTIRYLVVDTRNWLPGRKVLVSPTWIKDVYWTQSKVDVDLTQKQIENSPEYDPSTSIDRDYETQLVEFYGFSKYWE